ncbi:uncharacterized protein [Nicotiana sylvestris]|uniref:uncharacterized protein n=1 Tax=Nicotiana sylvestris TaxID=4096 RepID=UPI00388C3FE0
MTFWVITHLKFLSAGGRAVLIRYVLQAINIHTLAAVHPPKGTLEQIQKFVVRFFLLGNETGDKHHCISWKNLCYPYEGGSMFRSLEDTCKAFNAKQRWKFRTTNSLWSQFLKAKYCTNVHPTNVQWRPGQSHCWKAMCEVRHKMEEHIWWKVGRGDVNFWFDNWTKQGPLCSKLEGVMVQQNIQVFEVYRNGQWDWSKLIPHPLNFIKEMVFNTTLNVSQQAHDTPIWTCSENEKFSTVFAWNLFRQKRHISQFDKRIWHNDVPYKMAFLTWKATHGRIPTDDKVSKFGIHIVSKCCCIGAGMVPEVETAQNFVVNCWNFRTSNSITSYVTKIMPPIILWELWRSRCSSKYESENPALNRSISLITFNISNLVKSCFRKVKVPGDWDNLCKLLEHRFSERSTILVNWSKPPPPICET